MSKGLTSLIVCLLLPNRGAPFASRNASVSTLPLSVFTQTYGSQIDAKTSRLSLSTWMFCKRRVPCSKRMLLLSTCTM